MAARKNLTQFAVLVAAVAVVVTVSIVFQHWWNNRPGPDPQDVHLTATVNGDKHEVQPYMVCELGTQCEEKTPVDITVGDATDITLDIPVEVHDHDWSLLAVYDDPAASSQDYFKAYEKKDVTIPMTVDPVTAGQPRPKLTVVEVRTFLVGHDSEGEETPMDVVWSVHIPHPGEINANEADAENPADAPASTPVQP